MKGKLAATFMIFLMVASALTFLAGGATIEVTNLEEDEVLNTRVVEVMGTATPSPDEWVQDTPAQFDEGSYDNITLTGEGALVVDPYIGDFAKDESNPIIDHGGNHSYNEYGTVLGAVIKDGDTYKMWTMGLNRSWGYTLGYSTSNDGVNFGTAQNATIDLGDPGSFDELAIMPGTIIKDGNTYKMWYTGQDADGIYRIGLATSSDGTDWTKGNAGKAVLEIGAVNKFDGGGVAIPAVIKDGNTYKMWYSGLIAYSGDLWQIGYATSKDGVTWAKKNSGDPVLSFGKSQAFDKDGLIGATVLKDGGVYRIWYIGVPSGSLGYATSMDGMTWTRENEGTPIYSIGGSGAFDETGFTTVTVFRDGNDYKMYYTGIDGFGEERIGLSEASLEGLEGTFTSSLFDATLDVNWGAVETTDDSPTGAMVEVMTRVSNDRVDWSSWAPVAEGMNGWEDGRFIQYRISMTSPDGLALPTVSQVKLVYEAIERVEVSTDNSTWFIATGTDEWNISVNLKEGQNTVYIRVMDTTMVPTYSELDLVVDTIKPTGILQINSDDTYTTDRMVELSLAAVDASGVTDMRLATTDNMTDVEWQPFGTMLDYELPDMDGTVTVFVQLRDSTGLGSDIFSDSIILDTTAPEGSVVIRSGAPMTTFLAVPLTLSATDVNGISLMRISNDASFEGAEWMTYAATADWKLGDGDGVKTVFVEFMDKAGMSTVVEDTIILDTVAPTGTIDINEGAEITEQRQVTMTLTAKDANGVSHVMLSNEPDFLESIWVSFDETLPWVLPNEIGEQTVHARFKDSAGLVSDVATDTIILDIHEEGFEGSVLINDGEDYTANNTLSLSLGLIGDDGHSRMLISDKPDFAGAKWAPFAETATFTTETTDGAVTVFAKFRDRFGIVTDVVSDIIIVDQTPPQVKITAPEDGTKVYKPVVELVGEASDNIELLTVEVQMPNGQWIPVDSPENFTYELNLLDKGFHTLTVKATDGAGNTQETSVTIKYTDKKSNDSMPGFEATALVLCLILVMLLLSMRRYPRV
jgi:hypothetical protein